MIKIVQCCCKFFYENHITNYFVANLASNSFAKFATDSIAAELLANLNNKIANFGPNYLQNLLWIALAVDFATKLTCGFSCKNKTCGFSCENYVDLAAKFTCSFSSKTYLQI